MPDIVNDDDLSALAAEYVLGTLEADERTRANVLLDVDHGFRGLVRVWERRLGELHLMVEPVEPDARLWERIKGEGRHPAAEPQSHSKLGGKREPKHHAAAGAARAAEGSLCGTTAEDALHGGDTGSRAAAASQAAAPAG